MFHTDGDSGYIEYNFSPSMQWGAYSFDSYRAGMRNFDVGADPPVSDFINELAYFDFSGSVPFGPQRRVQIALSAVIEETDGTKSYWALRHPPGAPDFHHPDCFALTLEAPDLA